MTGFNGKKYIYLSEVNSLGGKSRFLGLSLLAMAAIVVFMMIIFVCLYFSRVYGKDLYSTEELTW